MRRLNKVVHEKGKKKVSKRSSGIDCRRKEGKLLTSVSRKDDGDGIRVREGRR